MRSLLAFLGFSWLGIMPVHAGKVAVLDVVIEGDAGPELRAQMERSRAGGLSAAEHEVIGRDAVARKLQTARDLASCVSTTCLERIGKLVGAERFVRARIDASGSSYTIELLLLG